MLYHKEVYWKDWFDNSAKSLITTECELSNHLWKHIEEDEDKRYDIDLSLLYLIVKRLSENGLRDSNREGIFEVEVENEEVTKCVVRCIYDRNRDISIVFRKGLVVTAWLNDKNDLHNTLDESKYERR